MFKKIFYKLEPVLFFGLVILHVVPIWFFEHFSTADGWTHSYNTFLLNEYHFGDFGIFADFYQKNPRFDPNLFINYFQLVLSTITSYWANDKIILSMYVLFFPLSIRYAIGAINKDSLFIAMLSVPITYNMVMFLGFFGYILSLPIAFFLVGFFLRHSGNWTPTKVLLFSFVSLLLYFSHIIAFGLTFLALGILNLVYIIKHSWQGKPSIRFRYNKEVMKHRFLIPLLAVTPALFFVGLFISGREPSTNIDMPRDDALPLPAARFKQLLTMYDYRLFSKKVIFIAMPLLFLMASLVFYYLYKKVKEKHFQIWDGLFLSVLALFFFYLFMPDLFVATENGQRSGGWIAQRVVPYLLAFIILLVSITQYSKRQRTWVMGITTVLTLGLFSANTYYFKQVDDQLDEFFSGDHLLKPHSTLLPVTGRLGGYRSDGSQISEYEGALPFLHASSKTAFERRLVYLENVEATYNYYTMQYKPESNPFYVMKTHNLLKPNIDLMSYEKKTGKKIDYVSVWLGRKTIDEHTGELAPEMKSLYKQLDTHYKKIFTSENGLMEIYEHASSDQLSLTE